MKIDPDLSIPEDEFRFTFIKSSGPGGQNINKLATAVQLRFDVQNSPSLPVETKDRLMSVAGSHMTQNGELLIEAKRYRNQERNRADALARLVAMLLKASKKPKVRRATKPSLAAQNKRMNAKRKKGEIKQQRQGFDNHSDQ